MRASASCANLKAVAWTDARAAEYASAPDAIRVVLKSSATPTRAPCTSLGQPGNTRTVVAMIHRSQDQLVESHADRILADERAKAAQMAYFEGQIVSDEGGPLRRRLRAAFRAVLRALTAPAGISESIAGIPPDDHDGEPPPPSSPPPPSPPPQYPEGWPWPWQ
jgi:hypothetical protein